MEEITQVGYYTLTYKIRFYTKYVVYLKLTSQIYNDLILQYYQLLFNHIELLELSNQNCLRKLEMLTVKDKNGKKPENYIDNDVPAYLRRSAINQAIGYVRSYQKLFENYQNNEKENKKPGIATSFNSPIIFYKGMYKDFGKNQIQLKLFDGSDWKWFPCKFKEFTIPEEAEILSPTIIISKDYVLAHIPVKQITKDITPVKQRMQKEDVRVCGISFSNSDNFAICTVLDDKGIFQKALFVDGGDKYKFKTQKILKKIKKHREQNVNFSQGDHRNYWMKLNRISDYYAHYVSKKIVDFCLENHVQVISIADLKDVGKSFSVKVGIYSPIYLRKRIIEYLKYKAFIKGIIVTTVRSNYTGSKCYKCRANVKRNDLKFVCENGHQGDYFFNSSMNIGMMCLKKFGKI